MQKERGQPRKACDRCARTKTSCDRNKPCASCTKALVPCSYHRLDIDASHLAIPPVSEPSTVQFSKDAGTAPCHDGRSSNSASVDQESIKAARTSSRVPFLLHYTSARTQTPRDFAHALDADNAKKDGPDRDTAEEELDLDVDSFHPFSMLAPFFSADSFQFDGFPELSIPDSENHNINSSHDSSLDRRTAELVMLFTNVQDKGSFCIQKDVDTLLTSGYLANTVDLFFRQAHRHVPIVHEPTFDIGTVELPLLLAIFMVGSVWTYPRDTYYFFSAPTVIEMTENYIFESELFRKLLRRDCNTTTTSSAGVLSLLQAATLFLSISFGFAGTEVRRRFRIHRFADLLSVTRSLKFDGTKGHLHYPVDGVLSTNQVNYIIRESFNR